MPFQKDDVKRASPDIALKVWKSLPPEGQNVDALNAKLEEMGSPPVSKTTFYRWLRMERLYPARIETLRHSSRVAKAVAASKYDGIPPEIVEALGLRLLSMAKGDGLDRAEDAITRVMLSIASKADQIASQLLESKDEAQANGGNNAIHAIQVCADAHHRIMQARMLISIASRNFAEGDRLTGEAKKFEAEASIVRDKTLAEGARTIDAYEDDAGMADEALAAMRNVEASRGS